MSPHGLTLLVSPHTGEGMSRVEQTIATLVGRGHGGTRAGASWLRLAGFDIGDTNDSLDRKPFAGTYEAGKIAMRKVRHLGGERWDLESLHTCPIPARWTALWDERIHGLGSGRLVAWKLPETVFSYPWLVRSYPHIRFVIWHRDPRDAVLRSHITDDLSEWGLEHWPGLDEHHERALSWAVQFHLLEDGPRPQHWCRIRLRDFVAHQAEAGAVVAETLGLDVMPAHPVNTRALCRWHESRQIAKKVEMKLSPYLGHFSDGPMKW